MRDASPAEPEEPNARDADAAAQAGAHADPGPSGPVAALIAVVALACFTWPLPVVVTRSLLGHPVGELDNHFWMSVFGGRSGAPMRNAPAGFDLPLIDPVHLLAWVPGSAVGPIFAYNLALIVDLGVAALGGWILARELGASRTGALVGMVATACSPFLAGMVEFGITEAWPVGWLALHAAALLRFGRTGAARDAALAGAALMAWLLSGWYHAAFGAVAEIALAAWALLRARSGRGAADAQRVPAGARRVAVGILAQGAVAAAPLVPLWRATAERAELWEVRLRPLTRPVPYPDWAHEPRYGADLLNFVLPRTHEQDMSRTVYLGVALLLLAAIGAVRRRTARGALLCAAPLLLLALGHWLRVAGEPVTWLGPLPAGWLVHLVERARAISHWNRAVGPATVFVAAAAALGATALAGRRPWVGAVLAGVVLVDAIVLSPVPWPRSVGTPEPPAALLDLAERGAGAILELPFDEMPGLLGTPSRRPYDAWQVFHRLPIAEHYEGLDTVVRTNGTVAAWQRSCLIPGRVPPRPKATRPPKGDDVARLRRERFTHVVVHPAFALPSCADAVSDTLGAPERRDADAIVWALPAASRPGRTTDSP